MATPTRANALLPKGIRLHRTGKFIVDVTRNSQRTTKTFKTLEEAILWRRDVEQGIISLDATSNTPSLLCWTLQQAYDHCHATVWIGKASAITNVYNGKAALEYFGPNTKLTDITLLRIDSYTQYLFGRGDKGSTINRKLSALSVMLKTAEERNALGGRQAPKIRRVKETENRIRFLSDDEERILFELLDAMNYAAQAEAIKVLLYTGFRCGELWKLEKRDVNLAEGTLTLWKTKNGRARTIPILDCIMPIIKRRMKNSDTDHIFPEGSNPWLRNAWEHVRELMGMDADPQFVPHMLRHTCATRLSQSGVSLPVIKEWLGHTTIQTTIRYAHFNKKDLLEAAKALSQK